MFLKRDEKVNSEIYGCLFDLFAASFLSILRLSALVTDFISVVVFHFFPDSFFLHQNIARQLEYQPAILSFSVVWYEVDPFAGIRDFHCNIF